MNWKVCATMQSAVALTFHGVALPSIELVEPQVDYHTYTTAIIYHTRNVFNIHCHVYTYICCQAYRHFLQCYDRCHRVLLTWPDHMSTHYFTITTTNPLTALTPLDYSWKICTCVQAYLSNVSCFC